MQRDSQKKNKKKKENELDDIKVFSVCLQMDAAYAAASI